MEKISLQRACKLLLISVLCIATGATLTVHDGSVQQALIPTTDCMPSQYIIQTGSSVTLLSSSSGAQNTTCQIRSESNNTSLNKQLADADGDSITFHTPGLYHYTCGNSTEFDPLYIVPAIYSISLCKGCMEANPEYSINMGEAIRWNMVGKDIQDSGENCTVLISMENSDQISNYTEEFVLEIGGERVLQKPEGHTAFYFPVPGLYILFCKEDFKTINTTNILATVIVRNTSVSANNTTADEETKYIELLYTHVAIMGAVFGVLLPVGAFLAHHKISLAHKITQPIGIMLALIGFVMVVVYVQLSHGDHFRYLVHGVIGLALLIAVLSVMPLLLVTERSRKWHHKVGHIVAFFGMGNVLLGLSILPAPRAAALTLCIVYGLWLIVAFCFYVFFPKKKKECKQNEKVPISSRNGRTNSFNGFSYTEAGASNGSLSNASMRSGPQPLRKNVISEDKMIQLRKKSLDFLEASRHRKQLDMELGLKSFANQPSITEAEVEEDDIDVKFKVGGSGRRDSKPDQDSPVEIDRDPLNQSSPEPDSPFSPPPIETHRSQMSPTPDSDDEEDDDNVKYSDYNVKSPPLSSSLSRAHTFNYGDTFVKAHVHDSDDNSSEKGGSLRITRHSKRARGRVDNLFNSASGLIHSTSTQATAPLADTPNNEGSLNDSYSQRRPNHMMVRVSPPDPDNDPPLQLAAPPAANTGTGGRRRKAALVPPIITTTPVTDEPPPSGCPFHSYSSPSFPTQTKSFSLSPRPIRRGTSPADSESDGNSPRPRRKKVSVAQIEATLFPPTPVNLQPPQHLSLSRSSSFNTLRTHHDVFADNAFRSVMQISQDAIICANSVGDIVYWSKGASKMFGYTPGEAIGSSLEMIIPQSYKEKHRGGISQRTTDTLKYVRKHSYTPEEQKHARLYAVHGMTKSGQEIPVEVNVTSFVIDGEIFYTGVVSELSRHSGVTRSRANSVSSGSDVSENNVKQRALAVGAQMKIAHKLDSAEKITREELERVLKGSLQASSFEVDTNQMEQIMNGIMKAGDPEGEGAISFVSLVQLLDKHQLYISESGLIARYGKTKRSQGRSLSRGQKFTERIKMFFTNNVSSLAWFGVYVLLNVFLAIVGVLTAGREGWERFSYGTGPVLSMNCVLVLLPSLKSLIHAMRGSYWMNKVFPLTKAVMFHVIVTFGILIWTGVHILTHLVSFALDNRNASIINTTTEHFTENLKTNLFPLITGAIILIIFTLLGLTSIKFFRKLGLFIPFHLIHWIGITLFYILLIIHGIRYINPSFWKWLIPAVLILSLEKIYSFALVRKVQVTVKCAGRYDDQSRTGMVELEKPAGFKFEPGQYVLLNLPWIGYFDWQPCHISSGPKDKTLTVYIPHSTDAWFSQAFKKLKEQPFKMTPPLSPGAKQPDQKGEDTLVREAAAHPAGNIPVHIKGPFGPRDNSVTLFDYTISTLVCGGGDGPHAAKAVVKRLLEYRRVASCHCGCQPVLSKLYLVWVIPSGNDFEWFTDYLSDLCEDQHLHRYMDIRVFLTNIDSPPDELASALLQLGLKTAGESCTVRRPSLPQVNNLYHKSSYGVPDFPALLDYISTQHSSQWNKGQGAVEFGVFTVGDISHKTKTELARACKTSSKKGKLVYKSTHIIT